MAVTATSLRSICVCISVWARLRRWNQWKCAGLTEKRTRGRISARTPFIRCGRAKAFGKRNRCRCPRKRRMEPPPGNREAILLNMLVKQPLRENNRMARNAKRAGVGNSALAVNPSGIALLTLLVLALMVFSVSGASENPAEALKQQFDAAKSSLSANDLAHAQSQYRLTVALGLRQLANLSISESQFEVATHYLAEALKFQPDDFQLQLDAAFAWFRRVDQEKAPRLIKAALASQPDDAHADNMLCRIVLLVTIV